MVVVNPCRAGAASVFVLSFRGHRVEVGVRRSPRTGLCRRRCPLALPGEERFWGAVGRPCAQPAAAPHNRKPGRETHLHPTTTPAPDRPSRIGGRLKQTVCAVPRGRPCREYAGSSHLSEQGELPLRAAAGARAPLVLRRLRPRGYQDRRRGSGFDWNWRGLGALPALEVPPLGLPRRTVGGLAAPTPQQTQYPLQDAVLGVLQLR